MHLVTPSSPFSAILQPCPEAFRARAPPLSARRSSPRTRGTKTSCRTRSPWTARRRTPTARSSKLLIGQDLGNPAYLSDVRFHQKSKLGWDMRFPKALTYSETFLVQDAIDKQTSPGDRNCSRCCTWIGFWTNWSDNLLPLLSQSQGRNEHVSIFMG